MSGNIPPASPAGPRSASTGPNGTLPTPTSTAVVNGVGPATGAAPVAPSAANSNPPLSQQNLNQIVSEQKFPLEIDCRPVLVVGNTRLISPSVVKVVSAAGLC